MKKILIINANYYDKITENLVVAAKKFLINNKTIVKISVMKVPGVFEIPIAIEKI